MSNLFHFHFGSYSSSVNICETIPRSDSGLSGLLGCDLSTPALVVCDENTVSLARDIFGSLEGIRIEVLPLPAGEKIKNWLSIEKILCIAKKTGLCRDDHFIGFGGGVVCDCTAFAASTYMRGAKLVLVPTTLLCMVDAAIGGKTGINLDGIKNLAGTFFPAGNIVIAAELLSTLPQKEWKSGIAELIKTAIIDKEPAFFNELLQLTAIVHQRQTIALQPNEILPFIEKAVLVKGRIVENDPNEKCENGRAVLNLGHSFGHALESALRPGTISHGEAVAWGIAKSCELGLELGITPPDRAKAIVEILNAWCFETSNDFLQKNRNAAKIFREALLSDKKKKAGKLHFVVPADRGVVIVEENSRITNYIHSL
ncbi:MAG: 3-dehydroquinate synthase [Treponema sp.]|nr:3-dehydroquinate synthase [Treponema sp.]